MKKHAKNSRLLASYNKIRYHLPMNTPDASSEALLQDFRWKIAQAISTLWAEDACWEIADAILESVWDTYFEITNFAGDTDFLLSSFWREIHAFLVAEEESNLLIQPTNLAEMQTNEYILAEELQKIGKGAKKVSQVIVQMRLRKELYTHLKKEKVYVLDTTPRWEQQAPETDEATFEESIRNQVTRLITRDTKVRTK